MITDDSAHLDDGGSLTANLLEGVARTGKITCAGGGADLFLMGLLAKLGLLSPLAFRLWCYVRPFIV